MRILLAMAALAIEAIVATLLFDGDELLKRHGVLTGAIRLAGPWVARFAIAFAGLMAAFFYLRRSELPKTNDPPKLTAVAAHLVALSLFALASVALYRGGGSGELVAVLWLATASSVAVTAALAAAPLRVWLELERVHRTPWIFSAVGAGAACGLGAASRSLWEPATRLTFTLVAGMLRPILDGLVIEPERLRIVTSRFGVIVSPECSGLEGVGLLLAFGAVWILLYRRSVGIPRLLGLLAAGLLCVYLLNAVRIAALLLIGHAGARAIAAGGFHSQAGWIGFSFVALGLTVIARRMAEPEAVETHNPVAPLLVPLLALVGAGMISSAMSAGFEWTYGLRVLAAAGALLWYRREYRQLDWTLHWHAPVAGVVVLALWLTMERLLGGTLSGNGLPADLASASGVTQAWWIAVRVAGAAITVPLAEELAFRAFLLRRLISPDFESLSLRKWTPVALVVSSVAFGLPHGDRWLAGTLAGLLYAWAMLRGGSIGDAVMAHAVTNALLAAWVLYARAWHLW